MTEPTTTELQTKLRELEQQLSATREQLALLTELALGATMPEPQEYTPPFLRLQAS